MWCLCGLTAINEKHNQLLTKYSASENWFRCTNCMKSSRAKTSYPLCLVEKSRKWREEIQQSRLTKPDGLVQRAHFVQTQSELKREGNLRQRRLS